MNSRDYLLNKLKSRSVTIDEFNFDKLQAPPLYSLLSPTDVGDLYTIAHSIKYSAQSEKKYNMIKQIMNRRGFAKLSAGTNRVVYKFLEDNSFVAKIAYDDVGRRDNPAEFRNQFLLKPFVAKTFEVSPCGTVAISERVQPIQNRQEYVAVADDVFALITEFLIGDYVLADIGSNYFLNVGIRPGFGCLLLDYSYCYKIDHKKLYCSRPDPRTVSGLCDGEIDYDDGFNFLVCTKCGAQYKAKELELEIEKVGNVIVKDKGGLKMKIRVNGGSLGKDTVVELGNTPTKSINISRKPLKKGKKESTVSNNYNKAVNGVQEKNTIDENISITPVNADNTSNSDVDTEYLTLKIAELKGQNESLKATNTNLSDEYVRLTAQVKELEAKIAESGSKEMEKNENVINEKDNIIKSLKNDNEGMSLMVQGLQAQNSKLEAENDELNKKIKELEAKLAEKSEETEEENSPISFHSDSAVAAAYNTIRGYFDAIIQLSGLLNEEERDKLEKDFDEFKGQCIIPVPLSEKDHCNLAIEHLTKFFENFDEVEDAGNYETIMNSDLITRIYKLIDKEVTVYRSSDNLIKARIVAGVVDENDHIQANESLTENIPVTVLDADDYITHFLTEDEYDNITKSIEKEIGDKIYEATNAKELEERVKILEAENENLKISLEAATAPAEDEETVVEETEDEENDTDTFSEEPIYISGVTKDIKSIYPNKNSKKVIILQDSNGEYITGGNNSLILIDKLDNKKLSDVEIVSSNWFNGVSNILKTVDSDNVDEVKEEEENEVKLAVNGVK